MSGGYDLDASAPSVQARLAEYESRSAMAAGLPNAQLDVSYGPLPRQKLDIFSAGADAPAIVYFHGGYWRMGSKDSRRFPAPEWNRIGVSWAAVNYRLLPEHGIADAVSDARRAVVWLAENARGCGLDSRQLHLSGNSAGAHLAAMAAAESWNSGGPRPEAASLSVVSGLFDLSPLLSTPANEWLGLTPDLAAELSPSLALPAPDIPVLVAWGEAETEAFALQSRRFADQCRNHGNPVAESRSPGADHFDIIGEYGSPGTPLFEALSRLVRFRQD